MKKMIFLFLCSTVTFAADDLAGGQLVLDQDVEWSIEKDLKKYKGDSPYIQDNVQNTEEIWKNKKIKNKDSSPLMGTGLETKENASTPNVGDFNYQVLGTTDKQTSLSEMNNKEILNEVRTKGKSIFNFTYFKDEFDYNDRNNIYRRTFEEGKDAIRAGYILIGLERYIYKSVVDITWGGNAGLSYNSAKGLFVNGEQSESRFNLYTIPLDIHLGLGLSLGRYIRLSATGGPSVMGLYQNRSDFENKEKGKNRRQVGTGYFATGKVQIAISEIFRKQAFNLFTNYDISRLFLNFEARTQNYSRFQDEDIEISGNSFGIGLSFEYF